MARQLLVALADCWPDGADLGAVAFDVNKGAVRVDVQTNKPDVVIGRRGVVADSIRTKLSHAVGNPRLQLNISVSSPGRKEGWAGDFPDLPDGPDGGVREPRRRPPAGPAGAQSRPEPSA